jgi:DNA sulfur modification protein DndC
MNDIFESIKEHMKEVYLNDNKILAMAWSAGKDSTLMLLLLWEMLSSLPLELRTKKVHLITSDTGVETPDYSDYVFRALSSIKNAAKEQQIPIETTMIQPSLKQSFWWKILGRGTLISTPNTRHRWCTHTLKISPTQEKLKELLANAPVRFDNQDKYQLILMLGTRLEESARRKASMQRFELSEESLFSRHSDFDEIQCYSPLKFVSADELWFKLMDYTTFPFGVDFQELTVQYGESVMECGVKVSSEQGNACGSAGSRQGCWTCGMVSGQDPMLVRHIEEGKSKYQYLLDWKTLMLRMRNDIRFREVLPRQQFNKKLKELAEKRKKKQQVGLFELFDEHAYTDRYMTFQKAERDEYAPGAMTVEGRRILLEYLLYIQEQTNYQLIHEFEINAILDCWKELDGIIVKREDLQPKDFSYDGELIFLPDKKINKKLTTNPNPVFYVTIDMPMEEGELYEFFKERQQATGQSYFFFPATMDFKEHTIIYNSITFVVCKEGIQESLAAHNEVFRWLGWHYGSFTEKTKKAALKHLMLSAIGEGLINRQKEKEKEKLRSMPKVEVPVIENDNGQFTLAI